MAELTTLGNESTIENFLIFLFTLDFIILVTLLMPFMIFSWQRISWLFCLHLILLFMWQNLCLLWFSFYNGHISATAFTAFTSKTFSTFQKAGNPFWKESCWLQNYSSLPDMQQARHFTTILTIARGRPTHFFRFLKFCGANQINTGPAPFASTLKIKCRVRAFFENLDLSFNFETIWLILWDKQVLKAKTGDLTFCRWIYDLKPLADGLLFLGVCKLESQDTKAFRVEKRFPGPSKNAMENLNCSYICLFIFSKNDL